MEHKKLDKTKAHFRSRMREVTQIQELLKELEDTGEVTVMNPDDSRIAEIHVKQDEVTDAMVKLAQVGQISSSDIIYVPDEDYFVMKRQVREDQ